jgi:hypothetical protein
LADLTFIVSADRPALVSRTCSSGRSSQHLERAEVADTLRPDNSRDQRGQGNRHSIHLTDRYTGEGRAHQVDTLSNYWSSVRQQQPDLSPAISGPGSTSRLLPSGHTFRRNTPTAASGTFLLESAELIRLVRQRADERRQPWVMPADEVVPKEFSIQRRDGQQQPTVRKDLPGPAADKKGRRLPGIIDGTREGGTTSAA